MSLSTAGAHDSVVQPFKTTKELDCSGLSRMTLVVTHRQASILGERHVSTTSCYQSFTLLLSNSSAFAFARLLCVCVCVVCPEVPAGVCFVQLLPSIACPVVISIFQI